MSTCSWWVGRGLLSGRVWDKKRPTAAFGEVVAACDQSLWLLTVSKWHWSLAALTGEKNARLFIISVPTSAAEDRLSHNCGLNLQLKFRGTQTHTHKVALVAYIQGIYFSKNESVMTLSLGGCGVALLQGVKRTLAARPSLEGSFQGNWRSGQSTTCWAYLDMCPAHGSAVHRSECKNHHSELSCFFNLH